MAGWYLFLHSIRCARYKREGIFKFDTSGGAKWCFLQTAVLRCGQGIRALSRARGTNANLPSEKPAGGSTNVYEGKTFSVDSACADCPGLLVWGADGAPAPNFIQKTQIVPRKKCLDLLRAAPLPPLRKQDAQHKF